MYRWCSSTIRIVTCLGLVTDSERQWGACLHSRAFLARNIKGSVAGYCYLLCIVEDGLSLQSVHLCDSVVEVVWGVLGTVAQSTNFNGVILHIQILSMQIVGDF